MKPPIMSAESEIQRRSSSRPKNDTIIPAVLTLTVSGEYSRTPLEPSSTASRFELSSMHAPAIIGGRGDDRLRPLLPLDFSSFGFDLLFDILSPIYFMTGVAYILSVNDMELSKYPKRMNKSVKTGKDIIAACVSAAGIFAAVRFGGECSRGITNGIELCVQVLVPSLFVYMFLAAYIVKSGASQMLAFLFKPMGRLFGLPPQAATAIALSMIGGYPVGAGCVSSLYEEGRLSESEAEKAAYIAVAAGPGFILNYVGGALLNSKSSGAILLAAQAISVVITGAIAGRIQQSSPSPYRGAAAGARANAFVGSVKSASVSVLSMCATVLMFSAFAEIISAVFDGPAAGLIAAFTEITTGCERLCASSPLYVTAFFIGFGGLSVHFQIFSALKNIKVSKIRFFLYRIIQGIISAAATYILMMITPAEQAVFSSTDEPLSAAQSATAAGSAALILLSVCFVGTVSAKIRRIHYVRNSRMAGQ